MSTDSGGFPVGVVRERREGERRVAMSPAALAPLLKAGARVLVEHGAGEAAGFSDAAYVDKGAQINRPHAHIERTVGERQGQDHVEGRERGQR